MTRILAFLLVALLLAGVAAGGWSIATKAVPVEMATVERGTIREYVDEQGITRLDETFEIAMPYAGRVMRSELRVGDRVANGQIVARISSEDLEYELAEAQAVVDRLKATLAEKQDLSVETTAKKQAEQLVIAYAHSAEATKAQLDSARRQLEYAEGFLTDMRRLVAEGAETEDSLEKADVEYVKSRAGVTETTQNFESAQATLAAMTLLPTLIQDLINRKHLEEQSAQQQLAEAEARLRQARLKSDRGTMRSPVDGIVLELPVLSEQFLAAGASLMTIGDLNELEVEADLLSQDAVRVQVKDAVEIYGPALGGGLGQGVAGYVARIYPQAFTKISSLGVEQQRVKVIVRFAAEERERVRELHLGVDYRVRIHVITAEKSDAVIIPRSALFRQADNAWHVYAVRDSRVVMQPVAVGLMNDRVAEVLDGLAIGESIVLTPENQLTEGTRVKPSI